MTNKAPYASLAEAFQRFYGSDTRPRPPRLAFYSGASVAAGILTMGTDAERDALLKELQDCLTDLRL
jgi:hypothetical protein